MPKQPSASRTGITLPLDVDTANRDRICRAALAVTRHRLDVISVDVEPLEPAWPVDLEDAVREAMTRIMPRVSRLTGRTKEGRTLTVDLDPRSDGDFALASALAAHTWTTTISTDQSIALDTELHIHLWVTAAEYVDLVEQVRAREGDVELLVPDPRLTPWYS